MLEWSATCFMSALSEPVSITVPRLVNGHDLMSHFGLKPGPHIGSLLASIEEARAAGEIETQEQGLELAAVMLRNRDVSGLDIHDDYRDDDSRVQFRLSYAIPKRSTLIRYPPHPRAGPGGPGLPGHQH